MSNRRTPDRHLAKLAARRQAERRRKRRQRAVATAIAIIVAVAGLSVGAKLIFFGKKAKAAAPPTPSHSMSPTPSVSPTPTATVVACGGTVPAAASKAKPTYTKPPPMTIDTKKTYTVTMETSCGTMEISFDAKQAPNTVNSLVFLIQHHFYDGLIFHRISQGFVIQGGDPKGDGSGGPGYTTVDAPGSNAKYPIGTVAMAKTSSEPNGTAGSQFFIVTSNSAQSALAPGGTGQYAIVGHVTSGLDVVNKIAAIPIQGGTPDGAPSQTVYMIKVTVKVS
jgi:peptidyl-prolyl cis-trans isomerase B (cyclophilin B)